MTKTQRYAPLGLVSSGTMRPEDLIPAFAEQLDYCIRHAFRPGEPEQHHLMIAAALDGDEVALAQLTDYSKDHEEAECFVSEIGLYLEAQAFDPEGEDAENDMELINDLENALQQFAAPYCYFGAHEGDGADYGFWISWDAIEDDVHDGTILRVQDWADTPPEGTEDWDYVLVANDHGNGTMYTRDGKEVWSVV